MKNSRAQRERDRVFSMKKAQSEIRIDSKKKWMMEKEEEEDVLNDGVGFIVLFCFVLFELDKTAQ